MPKDPDPKSETGFLERWSQRKTDTQAGAEKQLPVTADGDAPAAERALTDRDMPPVEHLTEDSDVSGFLSPGVSEFLRKRALRKLFASPGFNIRDGLDDYDDDFRSFAALGDLVTSDMKHQRELEEARQQRAQDQDDGDDADDPAADPAAGDTDDGDATDGTADADDTNADADDTNADATGTDATDDQPR